MCQYFVYFFQLENAIDMEWKLMERNARLKKVLVPHIFDRQNTTMNLTKSDNIRKLLATNDSYQTNPVEWIDCGGVKTEKIDTDFSYSSYDRNIMEWIDCSRVNIEPNPAKFLVIH